MLGPLAGGSSGNRGKGRLRTREVREIGGLEGPGSGRSSGLPPRTLFFPPSPKKWGPEVPRSSKAIMFRPLWYFGAETERQDPHFPRLLRFSEGSPGISFVPETPRRELSARSRAAERGGFRGPCFGEMRRSGTWESQQRTEGGKITDEKGRRFRKKEERGKVTDGGKKKIDGEETITFDRR